MPAPAYTVRFFAGHLAAGSAGPIDVGPVPPGKRWVVRCITVTGEPSAVGDIVSVNAVLLPGSTVLGLLNDTLDTAGYHTAIYDLRFALLEGEKLRVQAALTTAAADVTITGYELTVA